MDPEDKCRSCGEPWGLMTPEERKKSGAIICWSFAYDESYFYCDALCQGNRLPEDDE